MFLGALKKNNIYMLNISYISNKLHTLFFRGYSSAWRASALQAGGRRFDPD